jgi:hypothetical protein
LKINIILGDGVLGNGDGGGRELVLETAHNPNRGFTFQENIYKPVLANLPLIPHCRYLFQKFAVT